MATGKVNNGEVKSGKAYTPPKGRPTTRRNAQVSSRRVPSTIQWALAIVAFLLVLAAIFYFGRDFRGTAAGIPALDVVVLASAQYA